MLSPIQTGQVKAIAFVSVNRNPVLPDVPTIGGAAWGRNFEPLVALFVAPGTPDEVVTRLNEAMNEWTTSEDNLARRKTNASRRLEPMSVEQADAFLKSERDKYIAIVRSLDIQPQ